MILLSQSSSPGASVAQLLRWWLGELRGVFAPLWSKLGSKPLEIGVARNGYRFAHGGAAATEEGSWGADWGAAIGALARDRYCPQRVRLSLAGDLAFTRTIRIPVAALGRIAEILALQVETTTPFKRADVCVGWRKEGITAEGGRLILRTAIVKRRFLEPVIAPLLDASFIRVEAVLECAHGEPIPIRLPPDLVKRGSRVRRILTLCNIASPALAFAVLAACLWIGAGRQAAALAAMEPDIAAMRVQATDVRARFDAAVASASTIAGLHRQRSESPTLLALLEEISRTMPDTAWLTDLQLDGDSIQLAGFADAAAALIGELEASPLLSAAHFTAPVVRAPQEKFDRFNISLEAQPAETAAAGEPAS